MNYNSFYGCSKCLQKAKSFKTSELKFKSQFEKQTESNESNKHDGSVRLYTYSNDWKLKRTEFNYCEDLNKVLENINVKVNKLYERN